MIAFLVAGTASGVGKTTAALAIMAGLRDRGLRVQPFKCGPDFLDTGHHSVICQRPSRNLDTWMLTHEANREVFANATTDADAAVIEGMMGLFDGVAGEGEVGSSAEIAKLLNLPIVLVLDASKSARSVAAVVKGFESFDSELRFAGIVLNGVNGDYHYRLLEDAVRSTSTIPLLGRIPVTEALTIPERHLGLRTAEEESATDARRAAFAEIARRHLDIGRLTQLRHEFAGWEIGQQTGSQPKPRARFGIARDRAFSFYYEDNLDLMRRHGAELVPFSPLIDSQLPPDLDGLYLGGGYPELYAEQLSANHAMLAGIRGFAASGKPVYAECGGMLYLGQNVLITDGRKVPMTGVLPLEYEMTDRLVQFGYVEVTFTRDCLLGESGTVVRGHSFHYSTISQPPSLPTVYRVRYSLSGRMEQEGFSVKNVLASYVHLHFGGNPSLAKNLVLLAVAARSTAEVER